MNWLEQALCAEESKETGKNPWLSEHPQDIEYACDRCLDCPVFFECQEYVESIKKYPRFGVMAGEFYNEILSDEETTGRMCWRCHQVKDQSQFDMVKGNLARSCRSCSV